MAMTPLICLVFAAGALPATLFEETFDIDVPDTATFSTTYPAFTVNGTDPVTVVGGVATIPYDPVDNNATTVTTAGQPGEVIISADVGANASSGPYNVGLVIGGNRVVFHPGHSTGGSLRVSGPGGFGNTQLNFLPANGVLHHMEIHQHPTGLFQITVTDGNDPANVDSSLSWTNASSVGGNIGVIRSGQEGTPPGEGLYDNLLVEDAAWFNAIESANPLHWYRMDEQSGTTARDLGSGGLHGTYQNGPQLAQPGQVNPAARFNGQNDRVSLGGSDLSGDWSAEFLLKKQGVTTRSSLMRGPDGALRLDQWEDTGQVGFTKFGTADYLLTPEVVAPIDEFIHLAYVADSTSGSIDVYLDGSWAGSNPNYIPLPRQMIGGGDAPDAILDEVVIYDRTLSAHEIQTHYNRAFSVPEPTSFGLASPLLLALVLRRRRKR
jgi:hypothetical protein